MKTHASSTEARQKVLELEDSWVRIKGTLSPSPSTTSYPPYPYGQYHPSSSSVRSVGSRRGQKPTLSEFGLSATHEDRDDFEVPEKDDMRNWKRDVTWALETISEEIHAIRQRYSRGAAASVPASSAPPPSTSPSSRAPPPPPPPTQLTNSLLYSITRHITIDMIIIVLTVNLLKWARKNPNRVNPSFAKVLRSITGGIAIIFSILGINVSIR